MIIIFLKFEIPNPVLGYCQSTVQGLRILPPNMTAQTLIVFRDMKFFCDFFKNFQKY